MSELDYILSFMGQEVISAFDLLDKDVRRRITEIRVRSENYMMVVFRSTSYFISSCGEIRESPGNDSIRLSREYVDKLFLKFCEYSVYSNTDNIKQGFVTLKNGARIGLTGTAVMNNGEITGVKDITSLNIRIPHEVIGCSDKVLNFLYVNLFPSVIVAGMPSSGKTTLLRDMARQLSSGFAGKYRKVAMIDERCEFAGRRDVNSALNVGINTDVLSSFPKTEGIELATRTLSPEMIICDEVSKLSEASAISAAFSSGVKFALSVHIGSKDDLYRKSIIKQLIETGEFSYIILLNGCNYTEEILDAQEVYGEICRTRGDNDIYGRSRLGSV